jgi:tripartite-type tricarboxylate transporter receptor subunit TctC
MKSILSAFALVAGLAMGPAAAQSYPTKPVSMIVPFAAGGPTDIVARFVAEHMTRTLGQQIVIENVAGAGGTTGTTRAAQAAPDGYTIMMGHMGTHGAAPALYPGLKYDPSTSFEPVGIAASTPILIVASNKFAPKDLKEFVAFAKANPDKLNQAHAGIGSVSHSTCVFLNSLLGVTPTAVPYTGTGPALNDLISGQVDYMCDQIVNLAEQIRGKQIRAYAIAMNERSPALPDIPTTKEAGLPDYQVIAWNAIFAPKGTPKEVVTKLNDALKKALADETTRTRLLNLGAVLAPVSEQTPEWLGTFVKAEVARWTPVLKNAPK